MCRMPPRLFQYMATCAASPSCVRELVCTLMPAYVCFCSEGKVRHMRGIEPPGRWCCPSVGVSRGMSCCSKQHGLGSSMHSMGISADQDATIHPIALACDIPSCHSNDDQEDVQLPHDTTQLGC